MCLLECVSDVCWVEDNQEALKVRRIDCIYSGVSVNRSANSSMLGLRTAVP